MEYLRYFPQERFLILVFEQTMKDPTSALAEVARFLGVDKNGFEPGRQTRQHNASHRVRFGRSYALARKCASFLRERKLDRVVNVTKRLQLARVFGHTDDMPTLSMEIRANLLERYELDIQAFERLTGLDLSVWRR